MKPNDNLSGDHNGKKSRSSQSNNSGSALGRRTFLKATGAGAVALGFSGTASAGTDYYVSTSGSDGNGGTSLSDAFATIRHACSVAGAGDTVHVDDGTYYEDEVVIEDVSGAGNRLVVQAINKHGAHIRSQSQYQGVTIRSSTGVTLDGFEISFPSDTSSEYHGVNVEGNRITVRNCYIHHAPFSGIQGYKCDNILLENNILQANCMGTGDTVNENGSGISIYHPVVHENTSGYRIIVRNNVFYENEATNAVGSTGFPTDGNGIIMDDFRATQDSSLSAYTEPSLVENNLAFNNGGRGVHSFFSDNVTIRNNTCWYNNYILDDYVDPGEISVESGTNNVVDNNIGVMDPNHTSTGALRIASDDSATVLRHNIFAGPTPYSSWDTNTSLSSSSNFGNQTSTDPSYPQFVNPTRDEANDDFRLSNGSPAIDAGYSGNYAPDDLDGKSRPIGSAVDMGAYERGSSSSDTTAPTAPANLSSPAHDSSSVDLDWDAASDSGTGVDHYNVYVNGAKDHEVAAGTTSTTVSGLSSNTSYDFHVTAVDGASNESSNSSTVTVTTDSASTGGSTINSTSSAPSIDGTQDSTWDGADPLSLDNDLINAPSNSDLDATAYTLYDSSNLYVLVSVTDDADSQDSTDWWNDDSVEVYLDIGNEKESSYDGDEYQYWFRRDGSAFDETKNGATSGVTWATTETASGYNVEVAFPHSTTGASPSDGARLGFDVHAIDDDDGGNRDAKIAWYDDNDDAWENPASLGTLTYNDTGSSDTTAPTAPANLSSPAHDSSSVDLDWDAASDSGTGVDHYNVYVDGTKDHEAAAGTTNTTVSGLSSGTSYDFHVTAVDGASNESSDSNTVTVTTDSSSSNLLTNPGFENGSTGWYTRGASLTTVSSPVHNGAGAGEASNRGGGWDGPVQDVTDELSNNGQGTYDVSGFVRLASDTGNAKITIQINDSDGSTYVNGSSVGVDDSSWTEVSWSKDVSWNGLSSAELYIETESSTANLYVDDVSLSKS